MEEKNEEKLDFSKYAKEYIDVIENNSLDELEKDKKILDVDMHRLESEETNITIRIEELREHLDQFKKLPNWAEFPDAINEQETKIEEANKYLEENSKKLQKLKDQKQENEQKINKVNNIGKEVIAKAQGDVTKENEKIEKEIKEQEEKKDKFGIKTKDGVQLTKEEKIIIENIDKEIENLESKKKKNNREFNNFKIDILRGDKDKIKEKFNIKTDKEEPEKLEPTKPKSTKPEPTKPEPAKPEPAKPGPAKPGSAKPEPTKPEPTKPESTKPEPEKPKPTTPPRPEPANPGRKKIEPDIKGLKLDPTIDINYDAESNEYSVIESVNGVKKVPKIYDVDEMLKLEKFKNIRDEMESNDISSDAYISYILSQVDKRYGTNKLENYLNALNKDEKISDKTIINYDLNRMYKNKDRSQRKYFNKVSKISKKSDVATVQKNILSRFLEKCVDIKDRISNSKLGRRISGRLELLSQGKEHGQEDTRNEEENEYDYIVGSWEDKEPTKNGNEHTNSEEQKELTDEDYKGLNFLQWDAILDSCRTQDELYAMKQKIDRFVVDPEDKKSIDHYFEWRSTKQLGYETKCRKEAGLDKYDGVNEEIQLSPDSPWSDLLWSCRTQNELDIIHEKMKVYAPDLVKEYEQGTTMRFGLFSTYS